MARELTFDTSEITEALRRHVTGFKPEVEREEIGRVEISGDGIARVAGLPGVMANELLEFPHGIRGLAFNLEVDEIGCVLLSEEAERIEEGDPVKRTGRILSVPVGDGLLGRVVNPLGEPMDGRGPVPSEEQRVLEIQAPSVVMRQPVKEPLQTGIKAIDAMTPIGRGQRELLIGDRQTGKTAIAVDTIINQRQLWGTDRQVKCVYVAIGQKSSTVAQVVGALQEHGALEYTVVVNAPAGVPAPFKYIAPYSGSAMGQHWMYRGEHALIIFDDLSKQAEAYREVSLLLRRPAGREAYPGDVFYLHSRLLERCAKLSDELGGGSLTGIPLVETKGGDVSAYIPTNVISITDGQIYLENDLFYAGVRPAVNVGISVSRVGGNAQIKAMKQVAGRLRLDLAQYRELEAFAEFGSELDKASQAQLERGARVVEILKQLQYEPMPVERQVMSIYAVTEGHLDNVPVGDCKRFESEFLSFMDARHPDVGKHISTEGTLPEGIQATLNAGIDEFKKQFVPSDEAPGRIGVVGGGPVDKLREDVGWERVGEEAPGEEEPPEPGEDSATEAEAKAGPVGEADAQPPG
jgi:F-type H+/Na+-transporting ATPase subunit alpha